MSVQALVKAWNRFFFEPQSPIPIGLFRILYGSVIIANLLLLRPDWLAWYGVHSWVRLSTIHQVEPGMRLNLFNLMPQSDLWIEALFWVFLGCAVLLTAGLLTRMSSLLVFLFLTSIQQRNLFILHHGDTFLRVAGFFLIFAPAGAALSLDHIVRVRKGKEGPQAAPRSPWAQRMIQLELAFLYFVAFWWKSMGIPWVNGTALYYVSHIDELRRFPVPNWFQNPVLMKLGSWLTLALEFSLGVLIWFKELRYPVLLLGVLFHLFLEYWLNIPMFQWDVLTAYVLFIDPADLMRFWSWIRSRVATTIRSNFGVRPSPT
jgi:hypothetical protein